MFLKNQCHVAAWPSEIGRMPLGRRIAGEPIAFYRTESGQPVAFEDRCPHRLAPHSLGTGKRSLDERSLLTLADAGPTRARGVIARLLREENAEALQ